MLQEKDISIIREILHATANGPFFKDNWEFSIIFGVTFEEFSQVAANWPKNSLPEETVSLAINNCFNNLLGFPHGCEKNWNEWISISEAELKVVFERWRKQRGLEKQTSYFSGLE
ncbi:hypothetical protein [Leptospira bandrabouensis]|uniref:Uncharacterized protein n=1 Tax=Leptospira bandrabouensis TaxID=2484903 RepID=A0A6H3NPW0_9LEPT|nr:hypothetical protein [Leptospira bandrabouensis]MCG6154090.1 hypothetical protein [Leptospira bandrabouensis]TGN09439.1 hypothetical protein EHR07_01380 [Leptospira bandrabouensis]TGN11586.1 hypothetical protein EHR08_17225 [Leptospira bandrabouensis]